MRTSRAALPLSAISLFATADFKYKRVVTSNRQTPVRLCHQPVSKEAALLFKDESFENTRSLNKLTLSPWNVPLAPCPLNLCKRSRGSQIRTTALPPPGLYSRAF